MSIIYFTMPAVGAEIDFVAVRIFSYFSQKQWLVGAAQEDVALAPLCQTSWAAKFPCHSLCVHMAPHS